MKPLPPDFSPAIILAVIITLVASVDVDAGPSTPIAGFDIIATPSSVDVSGVSDSEGPLDVAVIADGNASTVETQPTPTAALTTPGIIDAGLTNIFPGSTILFNFDDPILNGTGNELVVYEAFSADSYSISVGSNTPLVINTSDFVGTGTFIQYRNFFNPDPSGPNAPGTSENSSTISEVLAVPIDLSDLGVAFGASVSSIVLATDGVGGDPLGIGVIPEPASLALAGLAGLAAIGRRRV